MTTSRPSARRALDAVAHRLDRVASLVRVHGHVDLRAELDQLVDRGGALQVGGDERGLAASFFSSSASLPAAVVLPEPCSPASRIVVGGRGEKAICDEPEPISSVSSSCTIFTTCWPGVRLFCTSCAERALAHPGDELLDDLEVDVRLEQRERTSRIARVIVSSSSVPRPLRSPSALWSFSEDGVETAAQ